MTLAELQQLKIWAYMPVKLQDFLAGLADDLKSGRKPTVNESNMLEAVMDLEKMCVRIASKADEATFVFLMEAAANEIIANDLAKIKNVKRLAEMAIEESGKSIELKNLANKI